MVQYLAKRIGRSLLTLFIIVTLVFCLLRLMPVEGYFANYEKMTAADVDRIARLYMDYYNQHEDGCWTHEKACRRIRQIVTVEDSLCLIQQDDAENTTGFAIGYLKPYDDLTSYWLEEIVILAGYQNKGFAGSSSARSSSMPAPTAQSSSNSPA